MLILEFEFWIVMEGKWIVKIMSDGTVLKEYNIQNVAMKHWRIVVSEKMADSC